MRKRDLKSIAAQKGHIVRSLEEMDKNLMATLPNVKPHERKKFVALNEKEKGLLNKRHNDLLKKEQRIMQANSAWTQELSEWLELMNDAHGLWKIATLEQKRQIAEEVFLELELKKGKVASVSAKEPYKTLEKVNLGRNGGRWTSELERLREYHREHGNLGKRYVDVIHEFAPQYAPRTEKELASMSRSAHW